VNGFIVFGMREIDQDGTVLKINAIQPVDQLDFTDLFALVLIGGINLAVSNLRLIFFFLGSELFGGGDDGIGFNIFLAAIRYARFDELKASLHALHIQPRGLQFSGTDGILADVMPAPFLLLAFLMPVR
jgi:hypothetical protein